MVEPCSLPVGHYSYRLSEINSLIEEYNRFDEKTDKLSSLSKIHNLNLKLKPVIVLQENIDDIQQNLNYQKYQKKQTTKLMLCVKAKFEQIERSNLNVYHLHWADIHELGLKINKLASYHLVTPKGQNSSDTDVENHQNGQFLQQKLEVDFLQQNALPCAHVTILSSAFFSKRKKSLEVPLTDIFGAVVGRICFGLSEKTDRENKTDSPYQSIYLDQMTIYSCGFDPNKATLSVKIGAKERQFPLQESKPHPSSRPSCTTINLNLYLLELHNEYRNSPEKLSISLIYHQPLRILDQNLLHNFEYPFLLKILQVSMATYRTHMQIYERQPKYHPLVADFSKSLNRMGIDTPVDKQAVTDFDKKYSSCDVHVTGDSNHSEGLFYLHEGYPKKLVMQIQLGDMDKKSYSLHRVLLSKVQTVNFVDANTEPDEINSANLAIRDFVKLNEDFIESLDQFMKRSFASNEDKTIASCIKNRLEQFQRKDIMMNLLNSSCDSKLYYPGCQNYQNGPDSFETILEMMSDDCRDAIQMKVEHILEKDGKLNFSTIMNMDGLKPLCDPNLSTCYQINIIAVLKVQICDRFVPLIFSRKLNFLLFPRRHIFSKLSSKFSMDHNDFMSNLLKKEYNVLWSLPKLDHNQLAMNSLLKSINYEVFHFSSLNEDNLVKLLEMLRRLIELNNEKSKIEACLNTNIQYRHLYMMPSQSLKKASNLERKIDENLKNLSDQSGISSAELLNTSKPNNWFNQSTISDKFKAFKDIFSDHSSEVSDKPKTSQNSVNNTSQIKNSGGIDDGKTDLIDLDFIPMKDKKVSIEKICDENEENLKRNEKKIEMSNIQKGIEIRNKIESQSSCLKANELDIDAKIEILLEKHKDSINAYMDDNSYQTCQATNFLDAIRKSKESKAEQPISKHKSKFEKDFADMLGSKDKTQIKTDVIQDFMVFEMMNSLD